MGMCKTTYTGCMMSKGIDGLMLVDKDHYVFVCCVCLSFAELAANNGGLPLTSWKPSPIGQVVPIRRNDICHVTQMLYFELYG